MSPRLHCLLPSRAHLRRSFRPVETADRDAVPAIERLVEQLRAVVALTGDHHPARVQIVLRGGCRFLASKLDQDMAQLGRRQAGPDDRTVQVSGKAPNFCRPDAVVAMLSSVCREVSRSPSCRTKCFAAPVKGSSELAPAIRGTSIILARFSISMEI